MSHSSSAPISLIHYEPLLSRRIVCQFAVPISPTIAFFPPSPLSFLYPPLIWCILQWFFLLWCCAYSFYYFMMYYLTHCNPLFWHGRMILNNARDQKCVWDLVLAKDEGLRIGTTATTNSKTPPAWKDDHSYAHRMRIIQKLEGKL